MLGRHWVAASAATLAALTVVGCGDGGFSERGREEAGNVLRYPIVTEPTTLDPGVVRDGDTIDLLHQSFEGLVQWSTENELQPLLAESWTVEDDAQRFVFTLKEGVTFHSGRELTAEDFKWSIERNGRLESTTPAAYLSDIAGMMDFIEGRADEISGIQVIDDRTLAFELNQPTPYFLGKLSYPVAAALDRDVVPQEEITAVDQMGGTGPFRVTEYEPQQIVRLASFADYHAGAPLIDGIERPIVKDPVTRLNLYKSGQVDFVMLERQDIAAIEEDPELADQLKLFQRPATWFFAMHLEMEPFDDRRVRQAIAMAIDKDRVVNELLGGVNTVATGIVPPGVPGHRPEADALPFDPERARTLLAEAGYPDGEGFPTIPLYYREARPDVAMAAEAVQAMLAQELNVQVELMETEWNQLLEMDSRGELPFFHMRWAADFLDPQNFLSHMIASYGPEMKTGYANPEFDNRTRQADVLPNMEDRLPLYAEAEDIALQDVAWIPIYYQRDAELHRPELSGLRTSAAGHLPHTTVTISRSTE